MANEQHIGKVAQQAPDVIVNLPDDGSGSAIWVAVISAAGLVAATVLGKLVQGWLRSRRMRKLKAEIEKRRSPK